MASCDRREFLSSVAAGVAASAVGSGAAPLDPGQAAAPKAPAGGLAPLAFTELGRSLVDLGVIRDVQVEDGGVRLTLAVTTMACPLKTHLAAAARAAAAALPGVQDDEVETVQMTEEEQLRIFSRATSSGQESHRIRRVVAVTSCTGAVGKSTVTALLATELARRGRRVGILDADWTEPSIPHLFGLDRRLTAGPGMPARTALGIDVASVDLLRDDPGPRHRARRGRHRRERSSRGGGDVG